MLLKNRVSQKSNILKRIQYVGHFFTHIFQYYVLFFFFLNIVKYNFM